ncbi:MAG: glycosyltransferase [Blastocatellia bacterium]|nr:glycosyltransferase [Blastocatellia bacterium]
MHIKTLHITNAWHQASGGIGTFYRALFDGANRAGRQLRMIVPGERSQVEEIGEFVRVYTIAAARAPIFDRRYRLLLPTTYLPGLAEMAGLTKLASPTNLPDFENLASPANLAGHGGEILRILKAERPDLIEICDKYSVSWLAGLIRRGWLRGIERSVLVGMSCERMDDNVGAFLSSGRAGKRWSRFYLGNCYLPLFDYHIANSNYTADELREAMLASHERQIFVRPMGAEIDDFGGAHATLAGRAGILARCAQTAQSGGGAQARLLLYAGRISPEKNPALLLEMMERLAGSREGDFRLVVAGSGPLADWFAAEAARRAPDRVLMLGHIGNRAELIDLYSHCDAFVHPNPREPFGIAPLEAMAAGLPLIAPDSGGVLSYANESNAWLAKPDADAFADAAHAVFRDAAVRKDRLARARWTAQQYRWPDVAARFFTLYDEMHEKFPTLRFAPRMGLRASAHVAHEEL